MIQAILTAVSLFGNYLNCRKVRCCFVIWIACNMGWMIIDITSGSYSRAVLDIVQTFFAIYGYKEWARHD